MGNCLKVHAVSPKRNRISPPIIWVNGEARIYYSTHKYSVINLSIAPHSAEKDEIAVQNLKTVDV